MFGPHIGSLTTEQARSELVRPVALSTHREWVLQAIAGLPSYWEALTEMIPEVGTAIPGEQQLSDLDLWFRHGTTTLSRDAELPNIIITPLVVLIQLKQYWEYLEITQGAGSDCQARIVSQLQDSSQQNTFETLGFCTGLLGAMAVASAHNRQEFEQYVAVALRLAMLLGALADARNVWDVARGKGRSVSFAVAWIQPQQGERVQRIIKDLAPDAHVAVVFDATRATVITTEKIAPLLVNRLRNEAEAIVQDMGMRAHIHSPDASWVVCTEMLSELSADMPGLQFAEAANMALQTYSNRADGQDCTV